MADAPSELAQGILRNIIPLDTFGQIGQGLDKTAAAAQALLQRMGVMQPPAQAAPPMNQPLPRFGGIDPRTGQPIIVPPGR